MQEACQDRPQTHDQSLSRAAAGSVRQGTWLTFLVVGLSCIFVYLQVFILPGTPRLASGDQAIYLQDATRMVDGEMIYRDYDHFTFPGTDFLYATLFKWFGVRAWIPQAMLVVLGGSMTWLIIFISKKLMAGATVYLPALLFITRPFSSYLDAPHHWYGLVATTAALAVLLAERTPARLVAAGVLVGVATFFTQTMALLIVGFALFLLWERRLDRQAWSVLWKREVSLLAAFAVTISACLGYFVRAAGAKQFFYCTVAFSVM